MGNDESSNTCPLTALIAGFGKHFDRKGLVNTGVGILVLLSLYVTSLYSYLLFHSLTELFSIVIACGIFLVAWNTRKFMDNNYLLFIGIAYLFVGVIDTIHTLGYTGMNVFHEHGTNLATQLWITARYTQALSLLIAPLFLHRKFRPTTVLLAYCVLTSLIFLDIFTLKIFPVCFIEGEGLTVFKKASEYIISLLLVAGMCVLFRERDSFDTGIYRLIIASIIVTIVSELLFTFYVHAYGLSNLLGHFLKLISFYLIYKAVIETGLVKPYSFLFRNLKQSEDRLKNAVAELEAFSDSASHDLRSPLQNISVFSELLLENHGDALGPEGIQYLEHIRKSTQRMTLLINDLLALSCTTNWEIQLEQVDISTLARTIADQLAKHEPQRSVRFTIQENLTVQGDKRLLRVALKNLIENAWKFTGKQTNAEIEFGAVENEDGTAYFVRDNGVGFDTAHADEIFEAFRRLPGAKDFTGSGIGLTTVRRAILRHGGRVWAEAREGATFYFTLE